MGNNSIDGQFNGEKWDNDHQPSWTIMGIFIANRDVRECMDMAKGQYIRSKDLDILYGSVQT